jgi:uncharacterized protein (TIGR02145 family)
MKRYSFLFLSMMSLALFLNCNPTNSNNNTIVFTDSVTDADGNVYHAVTIGTQTWSVENLKTTHFNDGTAISNVTTISSWVNLTTEAYCWYDNDSTTNKNTYGALYNWYAVNTGKLAPAGWHVPTKAEWDTLKNYLIAHGYNYDSTTTGNKIAKALASKTYWQTNLVTGAIGNNLSSNNSSGFSALPGGYCDHFGNSDNIGYDGDWWSTTEDGESTAYGRYLLCNDKGIYALNYDKGYGLSVRLVKNK